MFETFPCSECYHTVLVDEEDKEEVVSAILRCISARLPRESEIPEGAYTINPKAVNYKMGKNQAIKDIRNNLGLEGGK